MTKERLKSDPILQLTDSCADLEHKIVEFSSTKVADSDDEADEECPMFDFLQKRKLRGCIYV